MCLLWFLWLFLHGIEGSNDDFGVRVSKKVYVNLASENSGSFSLCPRLLNGTDEVGCQTAKHGDHGIFYMITNPTEDLPAIRADISRKGPYIIGIGLEHWTQLDTVNRLREEPNVAGVLVLWPNRSSEFIPKHGFSGDKACPNHLFSYFFDGKSTACDSEEEFNKKFGYSTLFDKWKKPVFLLYNHTEIRMLNETCRYINSKGKKSPKCAVQLRAWMLAAKDAETCTRRKDLFDGYKSLFSKSKGVCDRIGDENIFAIIPPISTVPDKTGKANDFLPGSILVLASRLDSRSMFDVDAPGVQSALTGLLPLLAAAEALGRNNVWKDLVEQENKLRHVMFAFFNGESFDYIGSSRMVYDMQEKLFPPDTDKCHVLIRSRAVTLEALGFFVEFNQLGLKADDKPFFVHADSNIYAQKKEKIDGVIGLINKGRKAPVADKAGGNRVPPSSYQTFLKHFANLPGIVITDFDREFNSKFYNSFLDSEIRSEDVSKVAANIAPLAKFVVSLIFDWMELNETVPEISQTVIEDLLRCFISDKWKDCKILAGALMKEIKCLKFGSDFSHAAVGPYFSSSDSRCVVHYLLHWYMGRETGLKKEDCSTEDRTKKMLFMRNPGDPRGKNVCIEAPVHTHEAVSPAFIIKDYNMSSGQYSTWVESSWQRVQIRVFHIADLSWEVGMLFLGMIVLGVSVAVVFLTRTGASILFPNPEDDLILVPKDSDSQ